MFKKVFLGTLAASVILTGSVGVADNIVKSPQVDVQKSNHNVDISSVEKVVAPAANELDYNQKFKSKGRCFLSFKGGVAISPKPQLVFSLEDSDEKHYMKPSTLSLGVGLGYHFTEKFRGSIEYTAFLPKKLELSYIDDTITARTVARYSLSSFMLRGCFDALTIREKSKLYLSAGVGLSIARQSVFSDITEDGATERVKVPKPTRFAIGYSIGTGVVFRASHNIQLDVGYSFNAFPGKIKAFVKSDKSNVKINTPQVAHEISASLLLTF